MKTLSLSCTQEIWCFFSWCAIVCVRGRSVDQQLPLVTAVNRLRNVIIQKKEGRLNRCHLLLIKVTALSNSRRQAFVHSKCLALCVPYTVATPCTERGSYKGINLEETFLQRATYSDTLLQSPCYFAEY